MKFILSTWLILLALKCWAQEAPQTNDLQRPVDQLSQELDIKPEQFLDCFKYVTPTKKGEEPSEARKIVNKQLLLSCLQIINTEITSDKLDAVMDKYRL